MIKRSFEFLTPVEGVKSSAEALEDNSLDEQTIPLDEPKHHHPLMKKCYEISPYIQEREARNEQIRTVFLTVALFSILFFSAITGLLD